MSHDIKGRPAFVDDELLSRPLPELIPPKLSPEKNPPYSEDVRSKIADLKCHPLLESALHLLNDDLFSAHFLLRKMQEDEWGKWLHACLHAAEGDLESNAKLWYEQVDPKLLSLYWGDSEPAVKANEWLQNVQKAIQSSAGMNSEDETRELRKIKWKELVAILSQLEKKFGWDQVDGLQYYTRDEDPSHKSNVLGEGWRPDARFVQNMPKEAS